MLFRQAKLHFIQLKSNQYIENHHEISFFVFCAVFLHQAFALHRPIT